MISKYSTRISGLNLEFTYANGVVNKKPVAWKYFWVVRLSYSGLGTGVFGPNGSEGNYCSIVMTRGDSKTEVWDFMSHQELNSLLCCCILPS